MAVRRRRWVGGVRLPDALEGVPKQDRAVCGFDRGWRQPEWVVWRGRGSSRANTPAHVRYGANTQTNSKWKPRILVLLSAEEQDTGLRRGD